MTKESISLQDLRRRIYSKAKSEPQWRFWGLYVHVCKMETLKEAYELARKNNGASGIDGVTFPDIQNRGVEEFLLELQQELVNKTYLPRRNRETRIPKASGGERTLGIPTIRDRVVQGALKLILEPIFEAGFQEGSWGYRPKRSPHQALQQVREAIIQGQTTVLEIDLRAYFDNVRHHILLEKVTQRVSDPDIMHLFKLMLKASGNKGVPQGGVISPLLANIYLNDLDRVLEKARKVTVQGPYTTVAYARFADDLVVLINGHQRNAWLAEGLMRRIKEELAKLQVELNPEKTRAVDLTQGETFSFLGFQFRRVKSRRGKWCALMMPQGRKRTELLQKLSALFHRFRSQPTRWLIKAINPILRGWCNCFRVGHSRECFGYIKWWVEKMVRMHLQRARKRPGFGWNRWSTAFIYEILGLYQDYKIRYTGLKA